MGLEGKRILVVEDDVRNMAIIAVTLKQHGATVLQDPWNSNTVEMLVRAMPVDLILLDLMLRRGESGYDILDEIRSVPALSKVPIVIVSASDANQEMKKAQEKGCMGYIEKPINYVTFPHMVMHILEGIPVWGGE